MTVYVELHCMPAHCGGEENLTLQLPEAAEVRQALEALDIALGDVGVYVVNGKPASKETRLRNNDTLKLFPVIAGG